MESFLCWNLETRSWLEDAEDAVKNFEIKTKVGYKI